MFDGFRNVARLARWLGPWADDAFLPRGIQREEVSYPMGNGGGSVRVWAYWPQRKKLKGAYLLGPGFHFLGAPHPRMDRLARVLASVGNLVFSPFISDYMNMRIRPDSAEEFKAAFDGLLVHPRFPAGVKPGVFAISFGSWLALKLATDSRRGSRVGGMVLFGGYADWEETIEFTVSGEIRGVSQGAYDIRNVAAVFRHLLEAFDVSDDVGLLLNQRWMELIRRTWEIDSMKTRKACADLAAELMVGLPEKVRPLFLQGCGVGGGAKEVVQKGLESLDFSYLNTGSDFPKISCPVYLVHGYDDDVIPYSQSQKLFEMLPSHIEKDLLLTGLYGHSRSEKGGLSGKLGAVITELVVMFRMLKVLEEIGRKGA